MVEYDYEVLAFIPTKCQRKMGVWEEGPRLPSLDILQGALGVHER